MKRLLFAAAFCLLTSLATASLGAQASAPEEAAIRKARSAQNLAIAAGNFDSVATFWVQDVAIVAGLGVTLQGRPVLRAAFAADSGVVYERTTAKVEVSAHWPIAWEEGSWTGRVGRGTSPPLVAGRYSAQWIKLNGRWLIRSEQFVALRCSAQACRWPVAQVSP